MLRDLLLGLAGVAGDVVVVVPLVPPSDTPRPDQGAPRGLCRVGDSARRLTGRRRVCGA
jgi:hypothetical protein